MRRLAVLLAGAALAVAVVCIPASKSVTVASPPAVIDGEHTPEMIPDRVAYGLMLRLVSNPKTEPEKRQLKAYIDQIGFDGDADANALLEAAADYRRRVDLVDARVKAIKEREAVNRSDRSPEAHDSLQQLRAQHDSIADDAINSFSKRLSEDGFDKLRRFVDARVKRKVKLRPTSPAAS